MPVVSGRAAEPGAGDQQDVVRDGVSGHDELQLGAGRAEFGTDRRGGDIDDKGVELGHELGREDRGEQSAGALLRSTAEIRGAVVGGTVIDALDPHPAVVHGTGYDVLATNAAYRHRFTVPAITATGIRNVAWTLFTVAEKDCPVVHRPQELRAAGSVAYTPADEESGAGAGAAPTP